jgi:hypothetical protein
LARPIRYICGLRCQSTGNRKYIRAGSLGAARYVTAVPRASTPGVRTVPSGPYARQCGTFPRPGAGGGTDVPAVSSVAPTTGTRPNPGLGAGTITADKVPHPGSCPMPGASRADATLAAAAPGVRRDTLARKAAALERKLDRRAPGPAASSGYSSIYFPDNGSFPNIGPVMDQDTCARLGSHVNRAGVAAAPFGIKTENGHMRTRPRLLSPLCRRPVMPADGGQPGPR